MIVVVNLLGVVNSWNKAQIRRFCDNQNREKSNSLDIGSWYIKMSVRLAVDKCKEIYFKGKDQFLEILSS